MKHTPKIHDGWTRVKGKKERAWKGVTFKRLDDGENGKIATDGTVGTAPTPLETFSNSKNIEGKGKGVPNVPLCKDVCGVFGTHLCTASNPEQRSETAEKPLKCPGFRDIREQCYPEAS